MAVALRVSGRSELGGGICLSLLVLSFWDNIQIIFHHQKREEPHSYSYPSLPPRSSSSRSPRDVQGKVRAVPLPEVLAACARVISASSTAESLRHRAGGSTPAGGEGSPAGWCSGPGSDALAAMPARLRCWLRMA